MTVITCDPDNARWPRVQNSLQACLIPVLRGTRAFGCRKKKKNWSAGQMVALPTAVDSNHVIPGLTLPARPHPDDRKSFLM